MLYNAGNLIHSEHYIMQTVLYNTYCMADCLYKIHHTHCTIQRITTRCAWPRSTARVEPIHQVKHIGCNKSRDAATASHAHRATGVHSAAAMLLVLNVRVKCTACYVLAHLPDLWCVYSLLVVWIMHVVIASTSIKHEWCKERNMASSYQTNLLESSTQSSNAVSQDTSLQVNHGCSSTDAAVLHCPAGIQCLRSIPWSPKFCTWHASMRSPTSTKSKLLDHGWVYNSGRSFLVCPVVSALCSTLNCKPFENLCIQHLRHVQSMHMEHHLNIQNAHVLQ